jgi:hypothetical protein
MPVLMGMFMVVGMLMVAVMVVMFMLMIRKFHDCPCAGNAATLIPDKIQRPARKAKDAQRGRQFPGINPQVDKGPQRHIPRDPRVTVKVQNLHAPSPVLYPQ